MNNQRKDILKKGIDVTLYPLPFRKGGKITNGNSPKPMQNGAFGNGGMMNKRLGDKTIKPGIEYASGGMMGQGSPIASLRNSVPMAGDTSKNKMNPLATAFTGNPTKPQTFKNRGDHDVYHRNRIVSQMQMAEPALYESYMTEMNRGNQAAMDALIAHQGGIPAFSAPMPAPKPANPTNWSKLGFGGSQTTGGYRYNAGQGKPALGSPTNQGMSRGRSKFSK